MNFPSMLVAFCLCALAACGTNVHPGDPEYPVARANPTHVLDVSLIEPPSVKASINAAWATSTGLTEGACVYWRIHGGAPVRTGFSITEPLTIGDNGHGRLVIDRFEPSRCAYKFMGVFYGVPATQDHALELASYKDDANSPSLVRIDLWCYKPSSSTNLDESCGPFDASSVQTLTREKIIQAVAEGSHTPPVLVGPQTRSIMVQVHDLDQLDHVAAIAKQ
jgi:hypothetical protein